MSHVKILDMKWVMWGKFHAYDLQVLGATVQCLVTTATWYLGFVQPWAVPP